MAQAQHSKAGEFVRRGIFAEVRYFAELERRIAALPDEQSRGAAFEVFAEAYLATQRRHDAAMVWPLAAVPTQTLQTLGLSAQDYGVDGVLQTRLGHFNAYQVKFRTGRPALTWRELSTFMGLADSPHIRSRVLLTNCDDLPPVLNERQGFFCIRGSDLDRMEADDFRALEAWLGHADFVAPRKQPQPHQTEALAALLPALDTHDRVSAIMACGTGKTLVALWIAEALECGDLSPLSRLATGRQTAASRSRGIAPRKSGDKSPHSKILVLVPSLALLRQTLHEWLRETSLPALAYHCVCSDPTVQEGLDAIATPQSDLDFQVSTDSRSVREFLDAPFAGVKIIFSTYQSARVVAAGMECGDLSPPSPADDLSSANPARELAPGKGGDKSPHSKRHVFDLGIFDEAHKTAGREGRNYAFALEDANLPIRKRLFLTATPRHYNPLRKDKEGDAQLVFSMDKPDVYGPQAYRLTFAEAARRGIICGYRVIISVITSGMVTNELLNRGEVLVNGDAIRARQVANQLALKDAIAKYGVNKVFTFHSTVKSAASFTSDGPGGIGTHLAPVAAEVRRLTSKRSVTRVLGSAGHWPAPSGDSPDGMDGTPQNNQRLNVVASAATISVGGSPTEAGESPAPPIFQATNEFKTFHVNGTMPTAGRERVMHDFRECARGIISNARCLTEGVDVPAVDMVAFLSPRRSRVDIVQATGRAMRRAPNKTTGYVLVPLYLEQAAGETIEQAVSRAEFDDVWDVLQSLQEQDEVLAEIIREMREERGRTKGFNDARCRERIEVLGPELTVESLRRAISANCIDHLGDLWDERFGQLQAFAEKFGHSCVPKDWPDNPALGGWVIAQRVKHKRGTLSLSRASRLQSLPGWVWDYRGSRWMRAYEHLFSFVQRFGHARVLQDHKENGFQLGSWVGGQRQRYKDGTLQPGRAAMLASFPNWSWDTLESAWDVGISALTEFAAREGHAAVRDRHTEGSCNLGSWVRMQRTAFKKRTLPSERIEQLEAFPGWIWDKREWNWEQCFERLVAFTKENGHSRVPQGFMAGEVQLGTWVVKQRSLFAEGLLSSERTSRLQALPGWVWDKRVNNWEESFLRLVEFVKREGHATVPTNHVEGGFKLGAWVNQQRQCWKKNRAELSDDRAHRLEQLAGWEWTPNKSAWEKGFTTLKQFASREGNCRVRNTTTENGFRLGQWVGVQRTSYRAGKLSQEKVSKLEGLPDWTWEPFDRLWETGFSKLQEYVRRHHNARVPDAHLESEFQLGTWVSNQRAFHKKGKLAPERVARLEAVLGWLWRERDTKWEECFHSLLRFVHREGHSAVPRDYVENDFALGQWVTNQRSFYRKGMLNEERRNRLQALPGWSWTLLGDSWSQAYGQLNAFAEREGHVLVPSAHVENGFRLGAWVVSQRQRMSGGHMSLDRKQQLEKLPGWAWDKRAHNWEKGFRHLLEFVRREGHVSVPTYHLENGFKLGQWVGNQRKFQKSQRLASDRERRLVDLPGWKSAC